MDLDAAIRKVPDFPKPGILFYDNVGTKMVLEDEDYIDADFKEFRTHRMILWKKYYNAVRKELDKQLLE